MVKYMYNLNKLKLIRKKHKYTIYDMANFLGITASFYCQIENGKKRLFYDMAIRISSIFNMKPDEIFYTKKKIQRTIDV